MNKTNDIPNEIRYIVPFVDWIERHPKIMNAILVIEGLAILWTVLNYNFTTNF